MKNYFVKNSLLSVLIVSIVSTGTVFVSQDAYAQQKGKSTKKLYRWVDEKGNVLYLDTLPQEALGKQKEERSINTGQITNVISAAKTEEEIAALKALEEEEKINKENFEKQKESDIQLLIFPTEEIALDKFNQEMVQLEEKIKIIENSQKNRQEEITELLNSLGDREMSGEEITKEMHENILNIRKQIINNKKEKQNLINKKEIVKKEAVSFITRYRWLKANPEKIGLPMEIENNNQ